MSEAPERITAWLSKDGSTRFEGGKLFPAGVEIEYVRADRIEELEAENADIRVKLAKAVEALTPSNATKAAYIGEFSFPQTIIDEDGKEAVIKTYTPWPIIKEIMAAILSRTTLKELTGGKDE